MRPFFKRYRNEQLVCCVTCGIRGVRGLRRARGAWTVAVQGVHLRTAASYEQRVRRASQTRRSNARQSKHNFKVRRYVFRLPRTRPGITRNLVFAALLSCLHCFADGRTHLCRIICQKDVYMTPKIAKACRLSSLGV